MDYGKWKEPQKREKLGRSLPESRKLRKDTAQQMQAQKTKARLQRTGKEDLRKASERAKEGCRGVLRDNPKDLGKAEDLWKAAEEDWKRETTTQMKISNKSSCHGIERKITTDRLAL